MDYNENVRTGPCDHARCSMQQADGGAHLVTFINHAIFSVVIASAAIIKSPSFSLDSSSMTTTNSPCRNAARASSIESNVNSCLGAGGGSTLGTIILLSGSLILLFSAMGLLKAGSEKTSMQVVVSGAGLII